MPRKSVTRSFTFDPERDREILELLDGAGPRQRSALVRQALGDLLRRRDAPDALTADEIIEACRRAIRLELAGKLVQAGDSELVTAAPESEAARNLAALRDKLKKW